MRQCVCLYVCTYVFPYIYISSSSPSCHDASMDLTGTLSPPISIVHRFKATSCIGCCIYVLADRPYLCWSM